MDRSTSPVTASCAQPLSAVMARICQHDACASFSHIVVSTSCIFSLFRPCMLQPNSGQGWVADGVAGLAQMPLVINLAVMHAEAAIVAAEQ